MDRADTSRTEGSIAGPGSGADFLQLDLSDAPKGGKADWLTGRLRQAIGQGDLPVGSRLPATRTLAADLQVSRGVVTEAYQRLAEDGQVSGHGRKGTVVLAAPTANGTIVSEAPPTGGRANPFAEPPGPAIFEALRATPARIDLSPGVPDLAAFPRSAWLRAERAVLSRLSASDLGYPDPRGAPELRLAVSRWLGRFRGIRTDPDGVLITSGTAQALGLLAQVLRATDGVDRVAVEDPGSLGVRQELAGWGLRTEPVPVDDEGVDVDELTALGSPVALVTPAHQFPTGVVLSGERRRALTRWAEGGGLIIEDDYDAEHRYDRPPVPALREMIPERVCYVGSVSKLLAPALRIGWMVPPTAYLDALIGAKRLADLGNAVLPQLVLATLMDDASGGMERHLRHLRRRHRRRRDAMIDALRTHLPDVTVHGAAAGLHLMVTLDRGDDTELAAAALDHGVKVQPLSWHAQPAAVERADGASRRVPPGLVLGYAASSPSDIMDGIAILGRLLRESRSTGR